jgi:hypothetical protein
MIIPIHIEGAVVPVVAWIRKVSHRNAPGAMSAMAFMVNPVKPNVAFISFVVFSAIFILLVRIIGKSWSSRPPAVRRSPKRKQICGAGRLHFSRRDKKWNPFRRGWPNLMVCVLLRACWLAISPYTKVLVRSK